MAGNDIYFVPPTPAQLDALMSSGGVHDAMSEVAEGMLEYAESIAPVATGDYRDNFRVEESSGSGIAEAYLVNDDPGAAAIEFGNDRAEGHHVFGQVIDHFGVEGEDR